MSCHKDRKIDLITVLIFFRQFKNHFGRFTSRNILISRDRSISLAASGVAKEKECEIHTEERSSFFAFIFRSRIDRLTLPPRKWIKYIYKTLENVRKSEKEAKTKKLRRWEGRSRRIKKSTFFMTHLWSDKKFSKSTRVLRVRKRQWIESWVPPNGLFLCKNKSLIN